jgi:hypothetical protein
MPVLMTLLTPDVGIDIMLYVACNFSLPLKLGLLNHLRHIPNAGFFFLREMIVHIMRYRGSGISFDQKPIFGGILIFWSPHFLHNKSKFRVGANYYTCPLHTIFSKCSIQICDRDSQKSHFGVHEHIRG